MALENKKSNGAEQAQTQDSKAARKEAKNKAFDYLKSVADKSEDKKMAEALAVIRPSLYGIRQGGGGGGSTIASEFVNAVVESGKEGYKETDAFNKFKIGRKEARALLKKSLKSASPEERVWINFNKDSGRYGVVGKGATPPNIYEGYLPTDETVDLQ